MFHLVPLSLGLIVLVALESPGSEEPTPAIRVFADLKHSGRLAGPIESAAMGADDFAIAVPLPGRVADRHLPETGDSGVQVSERLGPVRVEATTGATVSRRFRCRGRRAFRSPLSESQGRVAAPAAKQGSSMDAGLGCRMERWNWA